MKIIKAKNYKVCAGDNFIFDTNIWIFILAPIASTNNTKQKVYSDLLKRIHECPDTTIHVTSLILSEYINAVLRIYYNQWKKFEYPKLGLSKEPNFKKDYRPTKDYRSAVNEIMDQVKDILYYSSKYPDNFHNAEIETRILPVVSCHCDYNDAYLVHSCHSSSSKLVSDDRDLQNLQDGTTLITNNL